MKIRQRKAKRTGRVKKEGEEQEARGRVDKEGEEEEEEEEGGQKVDI